MKKLPSLKQLQYLLALHEHQHFGRAADACFISQSTLSAAITQLEDILDAQLLERDHKTFLFTPLGEEIVRLSQALIADCDYLVSTAKTQNQPMEGDFHLGCIPTIAPFILKDLLDAIAATYPKLSVFLREDTTDNVLQQVAEGKLDMAILSLPYPTEGLSTKTLARDPFHLIFTNETQNTAYEKGPTDWPDKSIILLEKEHCLSQNTLDACHLQDPKKIHPFLASSLYTLVHMANSGLGVTFLPQLAINGGILTGTELKTQPVKYRDAYRELGVVWRGTSKKQNCYQAIMAIIKEVLDKKIGST
jgi:LysR family hydrogen peroxide-inducible transcriptional activator